MSVRLGILIADCGLFSSIQVVVEIAEGLFGEFELEPAGEALGQVGVLLRDAEDEC
jgi:hypothetical protein